MAVDYIDTVQGGAGAFLTAYRKVNSVRQLGEDQVKNSVTQNYMLEGKRNAAAAGTESAGTESTTSSARLKSALALPGGGFRATISGLGTLRGMEILGHTVDFVGKVFKIDTSPTTDNSTIQAP